MSDLISRRAAIDAVEKAATKECARWVIQEIPPADVAPVRHGYWKQATPFVDTIECSECGYQWPEPDFASNYCPDCGAKMNDEEWRE